MKKLIVVIGLLTLFLTGCVVHDRHSGYRDGYRYSGPKYERKYHRDSHYRHRSHHREYNRHRSHGRGHFCPPGQAKKGRC